MLLFFPLTKIVVNLYNLIFRLYTNFSSEFIIIGCDGIWDCKTSEECAEYFNEKLARLKPGQPISSIIEQLLDDICATDVYNEKGVGCDNVSFLILNHII